MELNSLLRMSSEAQAIDQRIKPPPFQNGMEGQLDTTKSLTANTVFFFGGEPCFVVIRTFRPSIIELICHYISGINQ